jgi:single-stranded-DNA-specific exonuclease
MAAGLTVDRAALGRLRSFFEEAAAKQVAALVENSVLRIDGAIGASGATLELIDRLEAAGPYGSGHGQPIFAIPAHRLKDVRVVGTSHVKITVEAMDGRRLDGIAFRAADAPLGQFLLSNRGSAVHLAGTLGADHWQGQRRVQMRVLDAARAP